MKWNRADIGLLLLRIVAGGLLAYHGWDKYAAGIGGFEGMVDGLGLPLPHLTAHAVALFELLGGLAIVAGARTREVSLALAALFVGTAFYVKFGQMDAGLISGAATAEPDLLYLGAFAALAAVGPGSLSADRRIADAEVRQAQMA